MSHQAPPSTETRVARAGMLAGPDAEADNAFWARWEQYPDAANYRPVLPPHPAADVQVVIAPAIASGSTGPRQGVRVTLAGNDTLRLTSPATGKDLDPATVPALLAASSSQALDVMRATACALYAARTVAWLAMERDAAVDRAGRLEYEMDLAATDPRQAARLADPAAQQTHVARWEAERDRLDAEYGPANLDDHYALSMQKAVLAKEVKRVLADTGEDSRALEVARDRLQVAQHRQAIAFELDAAYGRLADAKALAECHTREGQLVARISDVVTAIARPDAPTPPIALPNLDASGTTTPHQTPQRTSPPLSSHRTGRSMGHRPGPNGS